MVPIEGTVRRTSADAFESTLMNVFRSKVAPPQVPASLVCWLRISIDGRIADVGPTDVGTVVPVPPVPPAGAAAAAATAQTMAHNPQRMLLPSMILSRVNVILGRRGPPKRPTERA